MNEVRNEERTEEKGQEKNTKRLETIKKAVSYTHLTLPTNREV